jgi:hypothetical protein
MRRKRARATLFGWPPRARGRGEGGPPQSAPCGWPPRARGRGETRKLKEFRNESGWPKPGQFMLPRTRSRTSTGSFTGFHGTVLPQARGSQDQGQTAITGTS